MTLQFSTTNGSRTTQTVNYLLYVPRGYNEAGAQAWPLILFLHGQLEWGDDPAILERQGIPRLLAEGEALPALVVCPQSREGKRWWTQTAMLDALLDQVESALRVDKRRVYLTGISMGGYGAWAMALAQPRRFAAVVPIAGGADYLPGSSAIPTSICELRDVPLWVFHGQLDNNVPYTASFNAVQALKECGGSPKLTLYPDADHASAWDRAYADPELWEWLFAQERPSP